MTKRTTAFNNHVTNQLTEVINLMAKTVNAHHVGNDFSVREAMNLAVKPEDREACELGWPFAKSYIPEHALFVHVNLPEFIGLLQGVTTPLGGHVLSMRLQFTKNTGMGFIPPRYTHDTNFYAPGTDPNVVARLTQLCQRWMQSACDYGLMLKVFEWLNRTYDKDPHHVRFLFPGILPLLKRANDRECTIMANKLAKALPNFTYDPLPKDKRAALQRVNELVAESLLYAPRSVPVPDVNHCTTSIIYRGDVIHQLWDRPVTPLFIL